MNVNRIVDTHFHVFRRDTTPNKGLLSAKVLQRDFTMADYRTAVEEAPIKQAIGVQVAHIDMGMPELTFMRNVSTGDPLLAAYVGWLPIDNPAAAAVMDRLAEDPFVVGIRFSEVMDRSGRLRHARTAIDGARRLGRNELVYDISVRPSQYEGLASLAAAAPETTFVLGHMGKPAMGGEEEPDWRSGLRRLAQLPNLACKVTAHVLAKNDATYDRKSVVSRLRYCFDCFGFERVMFGSNYPTCLISTSLTDWLEIVEGALDGVSQAERDLFFAWNAERIYGLNGLPSIAGAQRPTRSAL